jgi:riboflavin kinase/FMN adenylyltransferase
MVEASFRVSAGAIYAPGNHDGVHLGHRALLRRCRALANEAPIPLRVAALTFDPHPTAVISPERAPARLTTIARRTELLYAAGADEVVVATFDRNLAELPPEAFLSRLFARGAAGFVVGPDFRFGKDREGDIALLERVAERDRLKLFVEPPVMLGGERVSSSAIRKALVDGDVAKASAMLGRVHELEGEVVLGQQKGRTLGFPTANLSGTEVLHPRDGVYAVIARVLPQSPDAVGGVDQPAGESAERTILHGVANLGTRPTLAAGRSVETHLFDFGGDLYGKRLRIGFVSRVRDEQKFATLDALVAQIARDSEASRNALAQMTETEQERWAWI